MLRFLKLVRYTFWAVCFIILASLILVSSLTEQNRTPTWSEVYRKEIPSPNYETSYQKAIMKSRESSVKIHSLGLSFWGGVSTMTGTYFEARGKHYVITAFHGIQGPCIFTSVKHKEETVDCKEYVGVSPDYDYIIMEIDAPLSSRVPMKVPQDLPQGSQWKRSYSILNNIVYTGYPNAIGPLTLRGDVVGYNENQYLYVFSHAYGGASGAGVFTKEGKYIGYVVAIDVGVTELGEDVLENIVIVAPVLNVDWSVVLTN
jgi:hypothetical protein